MEQVQLQIRNTFLQATIEGYRDVLIFSIDRQYRYLIFNQAFKQATFHAYGTEVAAGVSMLDSITREDDRKKAKSNCDRALSGEGHTTVEIYGELTKYYYETKYNPIIDDKNQVIGVTVMSANVTERKLAEERLKELNHELESFAYSVSHDLRAPLRSINGYASILKEDYAPGLVPEAQRVINVICDSAHKMGNLIDDLLTFSRLARKEVIKSEVDMNTLVQSVLYEFHDHEYFKKAAVEAGTLLSAQGDSTLLKQVWINLISNALKYSSKKKKPVITIGCTGDDRTVQYYIHDNGVGFDMHYYDKLFGVFQRLHSGEEFEGTGVGLAIVQRIITRLGGKVWAEGKSNEGASFYFSLPR